MNDEDINMGFIPAVTVSATRKTLFSSCTFEPDKMSISPMIEQTSNIELNSSKGKSKNIMIPRRCLNLLSDSSSPTPIIGSPLSSSFESGAMEFNAPLSDFDSPIIDYIRSKHDMRRHCAARSFSSPVTHRKPLGPLNLFNTDTFSNRLNVSFKSLSTENLDEPHSDMSLCEMADQFPDDLEDFRIKKRTFSGRSNSVPICMEVDGKRYGESGEDDKFFDGLTCGKICDNMSPSAPTTFLGLIDDPIVYVKKNKAVITESDKENQPPCKNVFRVPLPFKKRSISTSTIGGIVSSDKTSLLLPKAGIISSDKSPMHTSKKKKMKSGRSSSFYDGDPALHPIQPKDSLTSPRTLQRSQSFDFNISKSPLFDMEDKNLIGDKSKPYYLPTTTCKHPDLKGITPDTLAEVLDGIHDDEIGEYIIVDCRYPYEYSGGHIKGAINIYEKPGMIEYFLKNPRPSMDKRQIVIFHCEFSSKRGPSMCRFLRNKDRDIHQNFYPKLYYPEMYLLEGGYKLFFERKKDYCEPLGYCEMGDTNFMQELRLFTKRSKSWSEDSSLRRSRTSLRY